MNKEKYIYHANFHHNESNEANTQHQVSTPVRPQFHSANDT